jgi:hypothetical protein
MRRGKQRVDGRNRLQLHFAHPQIESLIKGQLEINLWIRDASPSIGVLFEFLFL